MLILPFFTTYQHDDDMLAQWRKVVPSKRQRSTAPPTATLPVPAERVFGDR